MPDDVADGEALRAYLRDTDIFGSAVDEADAYLADAFNRFRITMALVPGLPPGARILELGSNPYFLTRLLLRHGYKVTAANYFGDDYAGPTTQTVTAPVTGEQHVFDFDHFNVEREPFPYADGSFDLVLCCEILEHLPSNPIHMLAEIHRVLAKPGGMLLLTTPNATRATNVRRILDGDNPYEELSGYGTYGRHNREYTVAELRMLFDELGYEVQDVFAMDIHPHPADLLRWVRMELADRGDNLFALVRAHGEPRWRYPRWLYSSRHALQRVVRPDLLAGHNDEVQATGLYNAEFLGERWACWTGAAESASITLNPDFSGTGTVTVEGFAPPPEVDRSIVLRWEFDGDVQEWKLDCDGLPFAVTGRVEVMAGICTARLTTSPMWSPSALGLNDDARRLGVAIRRVAIEPR